MSQVLSHGVVQDINIMKMRDMINKKLNIDYTI